MPRLLDHFPDERQYTIIWNRPGSYPGEHTLHLSRSPPVRGQMEFPFFPVYRHLFAPFAFDSFHIHAIGSFLFGNRIDDLF